MENKSLNGHFKEVFIVTFLRPRKTIKDQEIIIRK